MKQMGLTAKDYAKTLYEVLQETHTKDYETVINNFIDSLVINRDTSMLEKILEEYVIFDKKSRAFSESNSSGHALAGKENLVVQKLNELIKNIHTLQGESKNVNTPGVLFSVDLGSSDEEQ